MKKFISFFLFWLLLSLPVGIVFSLDKDKDKVFEYLKAKYLSASSLRIFFAERNSLLQGTLTLHHPNLFRFELKKGNAPLNIVVSDGKTVWNYSPRNKNVIISTIVDDDAPSLQNFFTNLLAKYKPQSLASENNSAFGTSLVLTLQSSQVGTQLVHLYLDKNLAIKAIDLGNEDPPAFYIIKKIQINPKLPMNYFQFKPPKGIEVFDYR